MNLKTAETHLPCFRSGKPMDPRTIKAARVAEKDELLRRKLNEQMDFDEQVVAAIHSIQPPENLRQKLSALGAPERRPQSVRSQLAHPAILSALVGMLLIVGFIVFHEIDELDAFPGKESVEKMIATTDEMSGVELEPTRGKAGDLGDAFYMRGFEGYALPSELAALPAVGTRVFKQNGHRVAQIAVDPHNALIFVFRAPDFGVDPGKESHWKVFTENDWVAAVRADKDIGSMITFRGDKSEMEHFLATLPR
jgi:hypothetical protein